MSNRDEVAKNIRDAVEKSLRVRVDSLSGGLQKLRDSLNSLVDELEGGLPDPANVLPQAPLATLLEKLSIPAAPAPAAPGSFDWGAFKSTVLAIDGGKTQVEILNAFLAGAAGLASRTALFVLKGDRVAGWKGSGFAAFGGSDDAVKAVALVPTEDPDLERVFTKERTVFVRNDGGSHFFSKLPTPVPEIAALIPMTIKERVAAVLYVDQIGSDPVPFDAVELLTLLTTRSIDSLAGRKLIPNPSLTPPDRMLATTDDGGGADVATAPEAAPPPPAPAAEAPPRVSVRIPTQAEEEPAAPPAPPAPPKPVVAAPPTPAPEKPAPPPPSPKPEPSSPGGGEAPAANPLAGGSGKSTQFIPPAHLQKKQPGVIGGASLQAPTGVSPEEAKKHDEAKRFARLLVSEIKLYNESAVNAGRKDGNVYEKLKDDIDRSRQMYEDRIPEEIKGKTNYFYDELVRILADGQPEKLGL